MAGHVIDMLQLYAESIYQHDWAPPHFANIVRKLLEKQFSARCIGRGSPYITWSSTSPDLTPPDLFLCVIVKDQVYRSPVCDLAHLQERIYAAVTKVTLQMLHYYMGRG